MDSYKIINIMISISVIFAVIVLFLEPIKKITKFLGKSFVGISFFLLSNYLLSSILGFSIGVNLFTLAFTSILGLPGVICLYLVKLII